MGDVTVDTAALRTWAKWEREELSPAHMPQGDVWDALDAAADELDALRERCGDLELVAEKARAGLRDARAEVARLRAGIQGLLDDAWQRIPPQVEETLRDLLGGGS